MEIVLHNLSLGCVKAGVDEVERADVNSVVFLARF